MVSLWIYKLLAAIVLFILTFICGIIPTWIGHSLKIRSERRRRRLESESGSVSIEDSTTSYTSTKRILSFLMNFGGGVLFATSFVHMLPEVREQLEKAIHGNSTEVDEPKSDEPHNHSIPVTEIIVCIGFFFIYLVEELVHVLVHNHKGHEHVHLHTPTTNLIHGGVGNGASYGSITTTNHGVPDPTCRMEARLHVHSHEDLQQIDTENPEITPVPREGSLSSSRSSPRPASPAPGPNGDEGPTEDSLLRCFMIVFALSFHSIFDGVAIGVQNTAAHMLQLFVGISIHKLLIAFVVGLETYTETKSVKKVMMYMGVFSVMSPLGIGVSTWVKGNLSDLVTGVLTALSTGSLIYITFFEILIREKASSRLPGLMQWLAVVIGFLAMTVLMLVSPGDD